MFRFLSLVFVLAATLPAMAADRTGWNKPDEIVIDGPDARIAARTGDIDNLGFGWAAGFDPFSGESTDPHAFPWEPAPDDPAGTDRIMVGSAFDPAAAEICATGSDGYTSSTERAATTPQTITVRMGDVSAPPKAVLIQMFIDDFQARTWKTRFQVSLNGERLPLFEEALAAIDQTGPIGKLISVKLFPEQFRLLEGGVAEFLIDDPESGACDGYAVDFVRVLIDPKAPPYPVALEGQAVDIDTREPIAGAIVVAALGESTTDRDGNFRVEKLPAGLVTAQASHPDYEPDMEVADLKAGETGNVLFEMKRRKAEAASMGDALDRTGRAVIPGIYFDTAKATLRPDSLAALEAVLALLNERANNSFTVEGHTDSHGDDAYNLGLSRERAAAVAAWLIEHGIDASRLQAEGFGESRPVADNGSDTGRQLNRRVEIVVRR